MEGKFKKAGQNKKNMYQTLAALDITQLDASCST
jgi:hypothetical protein